MADRPLIIGTAGHIDHGKTSLIEALTGVNTDRLAEEQQRGISIDLGFAHLAIGEFQMGIVDVPGHERFIRNMLAGATGIDIALLVVAADDSVMPQTREHLAILELLQVPSGVICITKCDASDDAWIDLVESDIRQLVSRTRLADAPIIRTSAKSGAGLDALRTELTRLAASTTPRKDPGPFQMSVDRCFLLRGLGTIVTGTVWSGQLEEGESVELLPHQQMIRVRSIQSHGKSVTTIRSGQRAALQLTGIHHTDVQRGNVLATPAYLQPSRLLSVHLQLLPETANPLRRDARLRLHVGTQEIICRASLLTADSHLDPGQSALIQLHCQELAIATALQPFVIRSESPVQTIGGGLVLQPTANRLRRNDELAKQRLQLLHAQEEATRLETAIYFRGTSKSTDLDCVRDSAVSIGHVPAIQRTLLESGKLLAFTLRNDEVRLMHADTYERLVKRICHTIGQLHEQNPMMPSVPIAHVAHRLRLIEPAVLHAVFARMQQSKLVEISDGEVRLTSFRPKLSEKQGQQLEALIALYKSSGFEPPTLDELDQQGLASEQELSKLLSIGVAQGHLVHIEGLLFMHSRHEHALRQTIAQAVSSSAGGLRIGEIRDLLGTSRKYVVPMMEYLDRVGVTSRKEDRRVPGRHCEQAIATEQSA